MNKTNIVKGIIRDAKATFMSVDFIKADKSIRTITFNPKTAKGLVVEYASEGSEQAVKSRKANNPDLVNVCDNELLKTKEAKVSWRSFHCDSVIAIRSKGSEVLFKDDRNNTRKQK